jgi:dihydrofolate synthase/folylpolyglutamate synthase
MTTQTGNMSILTSLQKIIERGHGDKRSRLPAVKATARALDFDAAKPPFKIIHIAGTNGKGTTATLLAAALKNAGFKAGLYISPHINDIGERVQINNCQIALKDLDFYVSRVLKKETAPLNFFEVLTLAAFLYFREQKLDYAVVECGIGGLKDSTNIFTPVLSIITSVGIDHADILGGTTAKIAAQKAGVIKRNIPCITGRLRRAALVQIAKTAAAKKAKIITPRAPEITRADYKNCATEFAYKRLKYRLNTLGSAQIFNAAIALEAAAFLGVESAFCARAFEQYKMPARFEICKLGRKTVIKDGAHNPAALKEFIKTYSQSPFAKKAATLIYGANADKDYKTAAGLLRPHFKNIILTSAGEERGAVPETLQKYFGKARCGPPENFTEEYLAGLRASVIVVIGSFYLASKIPYIRK